MSQSPNLPDRRELELADAQLVDRFEELLERGGRDDLREAAAKIHPADLADVFHHLKPEQVTTLLKVLPREQAAEVLPELDEEFRNQALDGVVAERLSALIDELDTDDAADVLGDLPEDVVEFVLPQLEDADEVRELLEYGEETAGGLMETDYVAVTPQMTASQATDEVRRLAEEVDPVYAVYVVDEAERLQGIVHLKRLLVSQASAIVSDIMDTEIVSVDPGMDQEEVAQLMERRNLTVLPVVGDGGVLLGRITIDDVVDVIREEAEGDIQRLAGIADDEEISDSIFKVSRGRLVWLALGMIGALASGLVINSFDEALESAVVLAMFIPIVMAMAGNAGMQSSAIAVQGLATGELWSSDVGTRLGKELAVALLNGVPLAGLLGVGVYAMHWANLVTIPPDRVAALALTVGIALLTVIVLAATVGATVPIVLDRFDIDPAVATGPFVTTSNDIIGLIIYFVVASSIYLS